MSRLSAGLEQELEEEYEDESELEWEEEAEDEAFLGALGGIARGLGGLLGEGEDEEEYEDESELEDEFEDEAFLGALGGIARGLGGLLGEGEDEYEGEFEGEFEDELELEGEFEGEDEAEEFFKRVGRALRKASPFLRILAKTAGPLVATAVGGPAAGMLARKLTAQLEGEGEDELEAEFEEMAAAPLPGAQALGEYLAAQAATAASESEAEAFAGVAAYVALSPRDRRDLERLLPALLRGAAVVTRLLRTDPRTRQAVRLLPGIVDAAGRTLVRRAAGGAPVGPAHVGAVLGATTRRVLSGGTARRYVTRRHARGLAHVHRHHGHRGTWRHGYGPRRTRRPAPRTGLLYRRPVRSRVAVRGPVARPRPGFVRVVTPVRVPPRGGRPARTVRVVTDVRVPRGAVSAGRPVSVPGPRRRGR